MSNIKHPAKHPNPRESGESPAKKKISLNLLNRFEVLDDTMPTDRDANDNVPAGSAAVSEGVSPPPWFADFEKRQQARLDKIADLFQQQQAALKFELDTLKQEVTEVSTKLALAEAKIDDLENRGRRNNVVIYNVPEGKEGSSSADCIKFISELLKSCSDSAPVSATIQRAHRTGLPHDD